MHRNALFFWFLKSGAVWRSNSFVRHKTAAASRVPVPRALLFHRLQPRLGSRVVTSSNRCFLRAVWPARLLSNRWCSTGFGLHNTLWRYRLRSHIFVFSLQGTSIAFIFLFNIYLPVVPTVMWISRFHLSSFLFHFTALLCTCAPFFCGQQQFTRPRPRTVTNAVTVTDVPVH